MVGLGSFGLGSFGLGSFGFGWVTCLVLVQFALVGLGWVGSSNVTALRGFAKSFFFWRFFRLPQRFKFNIVFKVYKYIQEKHISI